MKAIIPIAKNTFKEAIRDRILGVLLWFGVIFILFDIIIGKIAGSDIVIVRSFGLAAIYIFSVIITIFLGSLSIHKEIEKRTLYFVLSKPVSRLELLLGKYFGLFSAIVATVLLMTLVYLGVIWYENRVIDWRGIIAILMQLPEIGIFVALLILFSVFTSPLTAALSSSILLFVGHALATVRENAETIGGPILVLAKTAYYLLPNLEKFNLRNLAVHNKLPSQEEILVAVLYAFLYIVALTAASYAVFRKKEL